MTWEAVRNWLSRKKDYDIGDRHCSQCSGARRADWLDKAAGLLLPGVTYFQVVFTLPDKLSSLILGKLELDGGLTDMQEPLAWSKFTDTLLEHNWCVFIERPPAAQSSPEHVLKYLARYMTGGPISDRRLLSCENNIVTYLARSKDKRSTGKQVPEKLTGVEFTRCWSLHILPKGFTKSRCFGGYLSLAKTVL